MQLIVLPERARIDEPVSIRVEGLGPEQPVTLRARMEGYAGGVWASEASFAADAEGWVDLVRDAPIAGSYDGVDAMGLF